MSTAAVEEGAPKRSHCRGGKEPGAKFNNLPPGKGSGMLAEAPVRVTLGIISAEE